MTQLGKHSDIFWPLLLDVRLRVGDGRLRATQEVDAQNLAVFAVWPTCPSCDEAAALTFGRDVSSLIQFGGPCSRLATLEDFKILEVSNSTKTKLRFGGLGRPGDLSARGQSPMWQLQLCVDSDAKRLAVVHVKSLLRSA